MTFPIGPYDLILADPPWRFRKKATKRDIEPKATAKNDSAVIVDRRLIARIIRALRRAEETELLDECIALVNE